MTVEERFERIEHVTAALAEERRKDRVEYRRLWRETQRNLNDLTLKIAETNDAISRTDDAVSRTNDAVFRMAESITTVDRASRERDRELGERVDRLVSAVGEFLARQK